MVNELLLAFIASPALVLVFVVAVAMIYDVPAVTQRPFRYTGLAVVMCVFLMLAHGVMVTSTPLFWRK